jgi:uridine kinase
VESEKEDTFLPVDDATKQFQPINKRKRRSKTIYTKGRPPWYNCEGEMVEAFVIGLAGGSASGKTSLAMRIIETLGVPWVSLLSMDSFYRVLSEEEHERAARNEYNFDHPDAFDYDLMVKTLRDLKNGKMIEVPIYDFNTHSRAKYTESLYGANVIIVEGIMTFVRKELLDLMDLKIFVDTDSDIRLARRLRRDIAERGRELDGVLKLYNSFVKPAFQQYIAPSMVHADIVVPRGSQNDVALHLIVQHVRDQLAKRGLNLRQKLLLEHSDETSHPESLYLLPQTPQVRIMHTIMRNRETKRDDFVFYSNRLTTMLIEHALSFLPHQPVIVETVQGPMYSGCVYKGSLTAVSILRAGEVLEPAVQAVCKDIKMGKILIQTNDTSGEPELHFLRLPPEIASNHVLLLDATVATGAAALMAIRVLLDHGVPQENILFLSVLAAVPGIHSVAYAYPRVRIITTAVDETVNKEYHIIPGIGNYGDRYFGTIPED